MADEATIRSSLMVKRGNLLYQSQPTSFQADVSTTKGASPGGVTVTTAGVAIDLSQMTQPGLCRIMNLDNTNLVTYGIKDNNSGEYYELGDILPGETYVLRLSHRLEHGLGTGTGTGSARGDTSLFMQAENDDVEVLVEAFEA